MQRATWTDERLDEFAHVMRTGFERVDRDIRDLRLEIGALRTETRDEIRGVQTEIAALRLLMMRLGAGTIVALAGVIATVGITG